MNLDWLWDIISTIETAEQKNTLPFDPILHDARCAERMKAWEKVLYWVLDGRDVS